MGGRRSVLENASEWMPALSSNASQPINLGRAASGGGLPPEPPLAFSQSPYGQLNPPNTLFFQFFPVEPVPHFGNMG